MEADIKPVARLPLTIDFPSLVNIIDKHVPFIIGQFSSDCLGGCLNEWNPSNLKNTLKDCRVAVHVSNDPHLSFITKNFEYEYMSIFDLLERITKSQLRILDGDICNKEAIEYMYYRSLGQRPRKDPATLSAVHDFLDHTFKLPELLAGLTYNTDSMYKIHSSVFRIAQSEVELWAHYDSLDNLLVQVYGRKKVLIFPPSELYRLAITDTSSPYLKLSDPNAHKNNNEIMFAYSKAVEAEMIPGDILFIPAGWPHSVKSLSPDTLGSPLPYVSIAVNIFLQSRKSVHQCKNIYGNEDLPQMRRACDLMRGEMTRIADELPEHLKELFWSKLASIALGNLTHDMHSINTIP